MSHAGRSVLGCQAKKQVGDLLFQYFAMIEAYRVVGTAFSRASWLRI